MKITLNGKPHEAPEPATVRDVLAQLGFADRPVVVELNQEALLPREHSSKALAAGDVMEVVQITAGG
jgi:sulfur carrier protein